MALPPSTLSQVCRSVADFVSEGLDAPDKSIRVMIGNPADAAPKGKGSDHRVNLFFYRLEPSGFAPDTASDDTWWLRLHCLITAFGVLEDKVSAGENELRLLGELIRLFHETPVLHVMDVNGESVRLQIVFQPLSPDDINHLWSTQGDVSYRTSVAYEMALAPVVPREPGRGSPLVGSVGYDVHGRVSARRDVFSRATESPPPRRAIVDVSLEGWAPQICFVHGENCAYSLAFEVGSQALDDFQPLIVVAGAPGADVSLRWDEWQSETGWKPTEAATEAQATTTTIDPERMDLVETTVVPLPLTDQAGQSVLYAIREYVRRSDGRTLTVRSNPLLVTLYPAVA